MVRAEATVGPGGSPVLKSGVLFASLLCGCAATRGLPISAPGELQYRLTIPEARTVDVEILRVREGPAAFDFMVPAVSTVLVEDGEGRVLALPVPPGGVLDVPNDWTAIRYRYLVEKDSRDLARGIEREGDLLLPAAAVLLHPRVAHPGLKQTVLVDGTPAPDPHFLTVGGRRCENVVLLGPVHPLGNLAVCEWLQVAAEEAGIKDTPIAVISVASDEACPFGMSAGRSLAFLIGTEATTFANDTVALHTMLHLTIPPGDTWITEGLATYLTQKARGRKNPEAAWAELREGLLRGAELAGNQPLQTLVQEEGIGSRLTAATWAGVLFALQRDLAMSPRVEGRAFDGVAALLESLGVGENGLFDAPRSKERDALMR